MVNYQNITNIRSLISALTIFMNLINPDMQQHLKKTAYPAEFC